MHRRCAPLAAYVSHASAYSSPSARACWRESSHEGRSQCSQRCVLNLQSHRSTCLPASISAATVVADLEASFMILHASECGAARCRTVGQGCARRSVGSPSCLCTQQPFSEDLEVQKHTSARLDVTVQWEQAPLRHAKCPGDRHGCVCLRAHSVLSLQDSAAQTSR